MTFSLVAVIILLPVIAWWSALCISIFLVSRTALEDQLGKPQGPEQAARFADQRFDIRHSASLLLLGLHAGFVIAVLMEARPLLTTPGRIAVATGLLVLVLWLGSGLVATALARHLGPRLIASTLPLLFLLRMLLRPPVIAYVFVDEMVRRLSGSTRIRPEEEAEAALLERIEETQRGGVLDEHSATMLENIVEFHTTDVGEVMTPRTDIDGIETTNDLAVIRDFILAEGHSRVPVFRENLDHILGILYVKDLVPYLGEHADAFQLASLLRQPIVVPETKSVRELLSDFQDSEVHMAVVIDEYGGTAGIVTIEDVLEEIVGEIHDEHDQSEEEEPTLVRMRDGMLSVDGRYHINDLNEALGLDLPEDKEYDTVAGFILAHAGRVPSPGEAFTTNHACFTVTDADQVHIRCLSIEMQERQPDSDSQ